MHSIFALFPSFWNLDAGLQISLFENHLKNARPAGPTRLTRPKNPIRAARIPTGFSHFPYSYGLENSKPEGHRSGGRTGQNPSEPTRTQPYTQDMASQSQRLSLFHSLYLIDLDKLHGPSTSQFTPHTYLSLATFCTHQFGKSLRETKSTYLYIYTQDTASQSQRLSLSFILSIS
jgi:hypothetical protein